MRIIAGEFRGRRLLGPAGSETRPVTDRAKQSIFDILTPLLPEARVYDCFAGTGSMGLEALSRGAAGVMFFEQDRSAAARLRRNIQALELGGRSEVVTMDLFRWSANAPPADPRIDLIFLDPPYRYLTERADDLHRLVERLSAVHLGSGGLIIFRHDAKDELGFSSLQRHDQRRYGQMAVEFLEPIHGDRPSR